MYGDHYADLPLNLNDDEALLVEQGISDKLALKMFDSKLCKHCKDVHIEVM